MLIADLVARTAFRARAAAIAIVVNVVVSAVHGLTCVALLAAPAARLSRFYGQIMGFELVLLVVTYVVFARWVMAVFHAAKTLLPDADLAPPAGAAAAYLIPIMSLYLPAAQLRELDRALLRYAPGLATAAPPIVSWYALWVLPKIAATIDRFEPHPGNEVLRDDIFLALATLAAGALLVVVMRRVTARLAECADALPREP